jgi:hypothetical protein
MIGLPFANLGSVELKERMRYVETLPGCGKNAGQELYEVSHDGHGAKGRTAFETFAVSSRICACER